MLSEENRQLQTQALILQRKLQKLESITAENIRLRELLKGSERLDETVLFAQVIGVDPDPFTHELLINRGFGVGVFKGQSLLDSNGVLGQISAVNRYTSRALLITDPRHAIPVEVSRNGVRAVAAGNGVFGHLDLLHVPATADVLVGDLLVTSGLGGRFPYGYPVATVDKVRLDAGQPFAIVTATPVARLTSSRQVMLVVPNPDPATADIMLADKESIDEVHP